MSPGSNDNNENELNNENEQEPLEIMEENNSTGSEEIDKIREQYSELNNRFLRLAADFDNYKKRVSKEKSDLSLYANEDLVRELLTVLDNLKLAIDHATPESDIESTVQGIKLVYNLFISTLDKFGLSAIESNTGTEFDPRLHQALERIETEEITPGLILDEMIRGYMFKDRLLRPASVTVSTDIIDKKKVEISDDNPEESSIDPDENVYDLTDEELE